MQYLSHDQSPLGLMRLVADDIGLTGVWFEGHRHFSRCLEETYIEREIPLFSLVKQWLSIYFSGENPAFSVPLHLVGTAFQQEVWAILCTIPYGQTTTYGAIAHQLAADRGLPRMSPQAVGGAVGHNPVSILVPCHRVVGKNGSLTGYASGIWRKAELLTLEGADMGASFIPKRAATL